jgi:hypothetical protein
LVRVHSHRLVYWLISLAVMAGGESTGGGLLPPLPNYKMLRLKGYFFRALLPPMLVSWRRSGLFLAVPVPRIEAMLEVAPGF